MQVGVEPDGGYCPCNVESPNHGEALEKLERARTGWRVA